MKFAAYNVNGFTGVKYNIYVLECTTQFCTLIITAYEHTIMAEVRSGSFENEEERILDISKSIGDTFEKIPLSFDELPSVVKSLYKELNC